MGYNYNSDQHARRIARLEQLIPSTEPNDYEAERQLRMNAEAHVHRLEDELVEREGRVKKEQARVAELEGHVESLKARLESLLFPGTMRKVYVVTSGHYSDYRVDAIFSTEEKANAFIAKVPTGDCNGITEMELDSGIADYLDRGLVRFAVTMSADGTTEAATFDSVDRYTTTETGVFVRKAGDHQWNGKKLTQTELTVRCWARDVTHAVKITNEIRAQLIASGGLKTGDA